MNEQTNKVALIVAIAENGVIGRGGRIPWDVPADRKLFRKLTQGGTVIMGRKTFESLNSPLEKRKNIVLSHAKTIFEGAITAKSPQDAMALSDQKNKIWIIGGAKTYKTFETQANEIHVSWIKGAWEGDVWFPKINWNNWRKVTQREYDLFRYERWIRKELPA